MFYGALKVVQAMIGAASCTLQVIQEVLCWSRNPMEVRRLCARKEEIYAKLIGNHKPPVVPGVPTFLETLVKHNVSTLLRLSCLEESGVESFPSRALHAVH